MSHRITAVAVAVPANNEAASIVRCVMAIDRAATRVGIPAFLVVAADRCVDDTVDRARRALRNTSALRGTVVGIDAGSAGVARETAARLAISATHSSGHRLSRIWLATTDADSRVDADWLAAQLSWAERGLAGVTGLVRLDTDADPDVRHRYQRYITTLGNGAGHDHVHGANLGMRADWWTRVGGFPALATGEDRGVWQRLRDAGAEVLGVTDLGVTTSGRTKGRAPSGLADLLATISA
jgi:hypothetical protein